MNTQKNVDLSAHSTMRLGGNAKYLCYADELVDFEKLVEWANNQACKFVVIGKGSNIIWPDSGYDGLVIVDRTKGRKLIAEDNKSATFEFASGEDWDQVVEWTVEQNLSGLEFLSLIPGTVGAAPVQNIGAYGAEIADTLVSVKALDTISGEIVEIKNDQCNFSYRDSRFKSKDKGRFIITSVIVRLKKTNPKPPFYEALQKYLNDNEIHDYTPQTIRQAVIAIRSAKLPDPKKVANNGSFFTNPIISKLKYKELQKNYPDLKGWPYNDKVKISAGWLVEHAGFKDYHDPETGMATYSKQSLVLVNEHATSTEDLLKFKKKIVDKVDEMFGIKLEQEPEIID